MSAAMPAARPFTGLRAPVTSAASVPKAEKTVVSSGASAASATSRNDGRCLM
jgi:hypothetical protein